jgi:hypothetical protein
LDTTQGSSTSPALVRCQVASHAAVRATPEVLAQWRRVPPPITGQPVPASFVKHAEDQTLAVLAAVYAAIERWRATGREPAAPFAQWGVIAAGNFFGRGGTASAIQRFAQEGAWGVSPHVIPHQSLHAVSGTVSQLLRVYGPNFGIGGGAQSCHDAFLIAAAMLAEGTIPGLWLLLSGHEREWLPVENSKSAEPACGGAGAPVCEAAALALIPRSTPCRGEIVEATDSGVYLRIGPDACGAAGGGELTLSALVEALLAVDGPIGGTWRMPGAGWFELEVVTQRAGSCR